MSKELFERGAFHLASARIGVKLDYVVPVVNTGEIAYMLSANGYKVIQNQSNPEHFIGNKDSTDFYIDGSRRVFGASGNSIERNTSVIQEIFSITKATLDYDLESYVSFFESEINGVYGIDKNVYLTTSKLYQNSSEMANIREILGGKYSQVALKLATSGTNINSKEWHEITIEPKISASNFFQIRMICRSSKLSNVVDISRKTEAQVNLLVKQVILKE